MAFNFHLITNVGALLHNPYVREYPNTLCLAQLFANPQYAIALREKVEKGHRVILDNGAHEGIDIDLDFYKKCALAIQPTVVVLTDLVGRDCVDSRENSLRFVNMLEDHELPNTKFMYAAQGLNKAQVLEDYAWALENLDPSKFIIGFGQGYLQWAANEIEVNFEGTRHPMVAAVMQMPHAKKFEYHVLGARWAADKVDYSWWPEITGIDTIKPTTCTWYGMTYPNRPAQRSIVRESENDIKTAPLKANIKAFCKEYCAQYWEG